jgi:hypothetical protein
MKRKMHFKSIPLIILLAILSSVNCRSQEAFDRIFNSSRARIAEIENLGYKIIHLDLDRLSSDEHKETRISLSAGFKYVIAASGDQERTKSVEVELFEEINNNRKHLITGRDGKVPAGSSVINNFIPDRNSTYIVTVSAREFTSQNISTGRYYLIVASKPNFVVYKAIRREEAKYNRRTQKTDYKNSAYNLSSFTINEESKTMEHQFENATTLKYIIEMFYPDEGRQDIVNYQIVSADGSRFSVKIDKTNKTIVILEQPGKNDLFSGYRYILQ